MTTRTSREAVPWTLDEAEEEALIAASNKLVGEELEEYTRLVDRWKELKRAEIRAGQELKKFQRELLGRAQREGASG